MKRWLILITVLTIILLFQSYSNRKKTYFEIHHNYCLTGITTDKENLLGIKKYFCIFNVFIKWQDGFPEEFSKMLSENNILMITWEPYINDFNEKSILSDISKGTYDDLIKKMAEDIKQYGKPCFIRWGHEMNGNWYPWSGFRNGCNSVAYKNSYIRIKKIFNDTGTDNAYFVFSVNPEDVPKEKWNKFENYYPGNKYVDFLGISVYNWGNTRKYGRLFWQRSKWLSPKSIINRPYYRILNMDSSKAIILTEVGCTSKGGNKALWISEFFRLLKHRYRAIKGFVWFDIDKETDWSLTKEEKLFSIYKQILEEGFYKIDYKGQELFYEKRRDN